VTRKSEREIERAVEDMETVPDDETSFEERQAKARERWERDAYDSHAERLGDAYLLSADDSREYVKHLAESYATQPPNLSFEIHQYEEFDKPPKEIPEPPSDMVTEALLDYGEAYGVDGRGIRERHGDDWLLSFTEALYYEQQRHKAENSRIVWEPEETERDIRRWREIYEQEHRETQ